MPAQTRQQPIHSILISTTDIVAILINADPDACEYLVSAGIKPAPRLATALFCGIKTDTDNFVRSTVSNDIKAFGIYTRLQISILSKNRKQSEIEKLILKRIRQTRLDLV